VVDMGRMPDSVVAYLVKSSRQYVLQIATDKLMAFDSGGLPSAAFAVLVAEGHMGLVHVEDAMIRDGNAKDVTSQIVQYHRFSLAVMQTVRDPVPGPCFRIHLLEQIRMASS